jgi:D-psicose/D-tagatose/L-ribulose 3-epimerase
MSIIKYYNIASPFFFLFTYIFIIIVYVYRYAITLLGGFDMKFGIVYAYWSMDWEGEYADTITRAKKCAFDVLEIFTPLLLTLSADRLARLKDCAGEAGVELAFLVGLDKKRDLSSEDAAVRRDGINYVKHILEVIRVLGGRCFSGINYCAWSNFDGVIDKPRRRANAIGSVKELAKTAEEYGISYNLEVTNRFEQFILNTSREAVDFVNEVGSPAVNILLDAFHMLIEEDSMKEAILLAGNKLGHFHVGTNNRKPPQAGLMAWGQIAEGLKSIGYDKIVTLEPLVRTGGTVATDSKVWRDMTGGADESKMDDDAIKGLSFMKELLL